jgi:SAM-dependent methyltransferase
MNALNIMIKAMKQIFSTKMRSLLNQQKQSTVELNPSLHKGTPDLSSSGPRDHFFEFAKSLDSNARVLEIGTKQGVAGTPTHSQLFFPNVQRQNYTMSDISSGLDVDIVADLHALPSEWTEHFDCFVAKSVFEHLERPWIAAKEIARVLKHGGGCYVHTHQTFPIHGWPSDYFRFSDAALKLIFEDAGMQVIDVAYEHRAKIIPPEIIVPECIVNSWNADWPSYILVHIFAKKI